MDSRIREIEQWVAEAKTDLGECGREAYINKLFLLDAEIRAIIKADGTLPAAVSPRQQQQPDKVRRFSVRALALAGVAVLLLTASTVYLTNLPSNPTPAMPPQLLASADTSDAQVPFPAGYIPASITGEEILPDGWTTPVDTGSAPAVAMPVPAVQSDGMILAAMPQGSQAPAAIATPEPSPAARPALHDNEANVVAIAPPPGTTQPATMTGSSNNPATPSSYVGGLEHEMAFSWFPEVDRESAPVNQTMAELTERLENQPDEIEISIEEAVDNVDNPEDKTGDSVESEEPELDESALRELLENTLNKRSG